MLVFFLASFGIAHIYSLNFTKYVYIGGYHIHHFYFGTLALFLGGILGILSNNDKKKLRIASALIGIGAGMFADEIGLLLICTTGNRFSAYDFPDTEDIIWTITLVIVFFIIVADNNVSVIAKLKRTSFKMFNFLRGQERQKF